MQRPILPRRYEIHGYLGELMNSYGFTEGLSDAQTLLICVVGFEEYTSRDYTAPGKSCFSDDDPGR